MIVRFMENVFVDSYYPTIEATFNKIIKHKGKMYSCDIIDTAGQVSKDFVRERNDAKETDTLLSCDRMNTRFSIASMPLEYMGMFSSIR